MIKKFTIIKNTLVYLRFILPQSEAIRPSSVIGNVDNTKSYSYT